MTPQWCHMCCACNPSLQDCSVWTSRPRTTANVEETFDLDHDLFTSVSVHAEVLSWTRFTEFSFNSSSRFPFGARASRRTRSIWPIPRLRLCIQRGIMIGSTIEKSVLWTEKQRNHAPSVAWLRQCTMGRMRGVPLTLLLRQPQVTHPLLVFGYILS